MAKTESDAKRELIAVQNRKARHDYEVMGRYETGIVLRGTEVKSLRAGRANLKDSFALVERGEIFLHNVHIAQYERGNNFNHDPERVRKLLLHRSEIRRLTGRTQQQGLTSGATEDLLQARQSQGGVGTGPRQEAVRQAPDFGPTPGRPRC